MYLNGAFSRGWARFGADDGVEPTDPTDDIVKGDEGAGEGELIGGAQGDTADTAGGCPAGYVRSDDYSRCVPKGPECPAGRYWSDIAQMCVVEGIEVTGACPAGWTRDADGACTPGIGPSLEADYAEPRSPWFYAAVFAAGLGALYLVTR